MVEQSRAWVLQACVWGIIILVGCRPANQYQEPPPPKVTVAKPLVRDATVYLEETGTTEAVQRVEVRARVQGFLEEILFQPNDEVEAGQVLFKIEKAEFVAKRDLAKAELEAAKVAQAKAENDYERQKQLFARDAIPEMQLIAGKAELDGSIANIAAAQAKLDQAQLDLDYTEVRAPIKGTVGKPLVKVGNLVSAQTATHLTTIVNSDEVYANFTVSERDVLDYLETHNSQTKEERGNRALFLARANDNGFPYRGTLNFTDLGVEEGTGTFAVRGLFKNTDKGLVPGLFVRIRAPIKRAEGALLVPQRATAFDQVGSYVLIVNDKNEVERRNVKLGPKFGPMVMILEDPEADADVQANDRIVVDGVQRSRPGAVVDPESIDLQIDESLLNPLPDAQPMVAPDTEGPGDGNSESSGTPSPMPADTPAETAAPESPE